MIGLGEMAALGTALTWGLSTQVHGAVGRMVGPTGVTLLRLPYQVAFLALMCVVFGADTRMGWGPLALFFLSGFLGISVSDFCLYRAINVIGPAIAVLIMSTSTIFSTLFGFLFLGEVLPFWALVGIGVTLGGILWVLTEHSAGTLMPGQEIPRGRELVWGSLNAVGAAVSLAVSFIIWKTGMQGGVDPLWATFVRAASGGLAMWAVGLARGWVAPVRRGLAQYPKIYWMLFISCAMGSTGMWFAGLAVNLAPVGIATTLIGLQPIAVTLMGAAWYKRRLSLRTVTGIAVAFCGTAMIVLL
ncbi:MAG: DMT family transporter [Candidatus Adiutrix sp.]|jgi:drug/metabolite transporter (DMT)-like permease|nr:DMT family transporter [Candidatus Adiutrix sp.]